MGPKIRPKHHGNLAEPLSRSGFFAYTNFKTPQLDQKTSKKLGETGDRNPDLPQTPVCKADALPWIDVRQIDQEDEKVETYTEPFPPARLTHLCANLAGKVEGDEYKP